MSCFQMSLQNKVAGYSQPIMVEDYPSVTITVVPGDGSAKAQYTTSSREAVSDGSALWQDWPLGMVSYPRSDGLMVRVMAVRLHSSADATLEVLA
jgi:hypothetical protein